MPTDTVHLHYINANVEGHLPHALDFGPIYGRIATDENLDGQVITVVSFGSPRRYFVWSTFEASLKVREYLGETVVQGNGWHLCPPYEIPEEYIMYIVGTNLRDQLLSDVIDEAVAEWLLAIVNKYKPPGHPRRLKLFLKDMWDNVGNEEIERAVAKVFRTIKD
ncbi:MAG TPA: hypothetical protein PLN21_14060 [Gemmatales bacterium]|nr:hypothetical protein [Gemmatales bacterium]